ncbi:hypothetical protein [Planotetraspora mira]|uniref:Uncharacterized protein n=1 Tax=Planotetraspora mira TaxID=58121 RepID=A0A8J3U719_9ACTN|nr:hypothetical protein [Planotetraspora mira]GII33855.1 hypothetical protein Pmi06nite_72970 [Planotetraspora mira]
MTMPQYLAIGTGQPLLWYGVLLLAASVTTVTLFVALCVSARRGLQRTARPPTWGWSVLSRLLLTAASALCVVGLLSVFRLESAYATCSYERTGDYNPMGGPRFVASDDSLLPLGSTCRWDDGYTLDLVPSYANPGIVVSLAGAALFSAAARRQRRRQTCA